jgi:hypothetical protein
MRPRGAVALADSPTRRALALAHEFTLAPKIASLVIAADGYEAIDYVHTEQQALLVGFDQEQHAEAMNNFWRAVARVHGDERAASWRTLLFQEFAHAAGVEDYSHELRDLWARRERQRAERRPVVLFMPRPTSCLRPRRRTRRPGRRIVSRCGSRGDPEEPDPPGLTRRKAGRLAVPGGVR